MYNTKVKHEISKRKVGNKIVLTYKKIVHIEKIRTIYYDWTWK